MTHLPSPAALVTAAIAALTFAAGLLGLQIVLGLEYTAGGTAGTQASMVGAMVTLALLPVFFALSRRYSAPRYVTAALAVAFVAFLAYSLPATSGRTGEIKEAKANVESKAIEDRARIQDDYDATKALVAESNKWQPKACAGGPGKDCKSATFVLNQRQASLEKLAKQLEAFAAPPAGDVGSALWAWALGWFGITAGAIRKGSIIAFAVGLDFAIWSLVALGEFLVSLALAIRRAAKANFRQSSFGVSDADIAAHRAFLAPDSPPNRPAGGTKPERPNRPKPGAPDGRTDGLKQQVLEYIREELADGRSVPSNVALVGLFGGKRSTMSDWLVEWERSGIIPARRTVGRCKMIRSPEPLSGEGVNRHHQQAIAAE
jgi:hypothetical protein